MRQHMMGLGAAAALAMAAVAAPGVEGDTTAPGRRDFHKPSGSKPVPGGGKRERVKRLSRIVRRWMFDQSWHPTGHEMPGVTREQVAAYVINQFPDLGADMQAAVVEASI